jgi:hypothetical protein
MHTSSCTKASKAITSERRAAPRREVDLLMNRFLDGYPYLCRASDISRTGMRIHPISGGGADASRFVGLQFQLPGCPEVLTASGEVVSSSERGTCSVRFTRMPTVSAASLGRFLAAQ